MQRNAKYVEIIQKLITRCLKLPQVWNQKDASKHFRLYLPKYINRIKQSNKVHIDYIVEATNINLQ